MLVTPQDIYEALDEPINDIINTIHYIVDRTPPELSADLLEKGALMTGGGSLINGLSQRIEDRLGISVRVSDNPIAAIVIGTGKALSSIESLEIDETSYSDARRKTIENQEMLRRR